MNLGMKATTAGPVKTIGVLTLPFFHAPLALGGV